MREKRVGEEQPIKVHIWTTQKHLNLINAKESSSRKNAGIGSNLRELLDDYIKLKKIHEQQAKKLDQLIVSLNEITPLLYDKNGVFLHDKDRLAKFKTLLDNFKALMNIYCFDESLLSKDQVEIITKARLVAWKHCQS